MSDSDNDSYVSDHDENIEESIKPIEDYEQYEEPIKPKRIMSEKQLENLKKARLIAQAKLREKKKETQLMKNKEQELKILKKLEKNITVDKKIKELKQKIVIEKDIKKTKPKKKKIVYVSESESDASEEEIIYKKKPRSIKPRSGKPKPKALVEEIVDDITKEEEREKKMNDMMVEKHYNDKIALIKKEYLMKSIFHS